LISAALEIDNHADPNEDDRGKDTAHHASCVRRLVALRGRGALGRLKGLGFRV
jgi:hypothetical protein